MSGMRIRLVVLCLLSSGCASIAINAAPKKKPTLVQSDHSKLVNDVFWAALHGGQYDQLPSVLEQLTQAYLADPNDAITTAHLGFAYIWQISERARSAEKRATITADLVLSERFFAEAVEMTGDPRFAGFLAGAQMAVGTVHKDERKLREGFFRMKDAVAAFPEFNLFARGYSGAGQPIDSDRFKQGLNDMWANMDFCFGRSLPHDNPDYTPVMSMQTEVGPKRVCWNGWIAPHNHEGFALNLGDMLTKAGETRAARVMYNNAKLSPTYDQWPYRAVLEKRLEQLDENVGLFRQKPDEIPADRRMMNASGFSCGACHEGIVASR